MLAATCVTKCSASSGLYRLSSSPSMSSRLSCAARAGLLVALEVLGRDLVEELLELVHDLFGVLDLVLELDRRLGDDVLGGEDRRPGADRQGQRVGRPRVDLHLASVN